MKNLEMRTVYAYFVIKINRFYDRDVLVVSGL